MLCIVVCCIVLQMSATTVYELIRVLFSAALLLIERSSGMNRITMVTREKKKVEPPILFYVFWVHHILFKEWVHHRKPPQMKGMKLQHSRLVSSVQQRVPAWIQRFSQQQMIKKLHCKVCRCHSGVSSYPLCASVRAILCREHLKRTVRLIRLKQIGAWQTTVTAKPRFSPQM